MSKVFKIAATEQTLEVVLHSFLKEIEVYYNTTTNTQKQLNTPITVITDRNGYYVYSNGKTDNDESMVLTPLQMIWRNISIYLQESGYNTTEIGQTYTLLSVLDEQYKKPLALLEYCLHYCLYNKQPLCLMATKAGKGKIIGCENMETFYNCDDEDFYINIRLHKILKKALPSFELCSNSYYTVTVSAKEKDILHTIHTNTHLEEITLKTKDRKIASAQFCEVVPLDGKKYTELMNEKSDQTLTIKRHKGKDAFIKRIYQKVFNNN